MHLHIMATSACTQTVLPGSSPQSNIDIICFEFDAMYWIRSLKTCLTCQELRDRIGLPREHLAFYGVIPATCVLIESTPDQVCRQLVQQLFLNYASPSICICNIMWKAPMHPRVMTQFFPRLHQTNIYISDLFDENILDVQVDSEQMLQD